MKSKNFSYQDLEKVSIYSLQVFKICQMYRANGPGEPFYQFFILALIPGQYQQGIY